MRVKPTRKTPPTAISRPLSIVDTLCTNFGFSAWKIYRTPENKDVFQPALLTRSLAHVLAAYPHWAGRVRLSRPSDVGRPYQKRYGRLWVDYGTSTDPGVQLTFVQRAERLSDCLPWPGDNGITDQATLDAAQLPPHPDEIIHLRTSQAAPNPPAVAIRVSTFACGSVVLGFRVSHTLADATSFELFVQDWATAHRAFVKGDPSPPLPARTFDPEALDARAAGDLDSVVADPEIEARYDQLPRTSFDNWADPENHPPGLVNNSAPAPELRDMDAALGRTRGDPAPWLTWDLRAPVEVCSLELTPDELKRIWQHGQDPDDPTFTTLPKNSRTSTHDALVAHFWRLSVRARDLPDGTVVSLTPAIGLRPRLAPPLSPSFVGSSFVLLSSRVEKTAMVEPGSGLVKAASAIRSTINAATPDALSALLHHHAHELDPTRLQPSFCGDHHTGMSSWIGSGAYLADFGTGRPIQADGALGPVDNMFLFQDLPVGEGADGGKWYDRGASVKLSLRSDVMKRVLADPELRGSF